MSRYVPNQPLRDYEVIADFGPSAVPLTLSIQKNINNCIDIVKQDRLDVIRLDNELKSSKQNVHQRLNDDTAYQLEINQTLSHQQSEKIQLTRDITLLKSTLESKEDIVRKSDFTTKELISRNKEMARTLAKSRRRSTPLHRTFST